MDRVVVTWMRGPNSGRRIELTADVVTFGRRDTCSVVFGDNDATVSGRHAEARRTMAGWTLRDLGSMNGTWVAGARITTEQMLRDGTVFELGRDGPLLRFDILDDAEAIWNATAPRGEVLPLPPPASRRTAMVRLIRQAVDHSSRRLRWMLLGLALLVVLGVVVVVVVAGSRSGPAAGIATRYERALFMLVAERGGTATGFCTAFAIAEDGVLATNAHCARAAADQRALGAHIVARMNRAPERTFAVLGWKEHPNYDGTPLSPDVALVRLDLAGATLPVVAPLASDADVRALTAGQTIYTMGFPGQVMNETQPAADFREAVVSRLTTWDNAPGDAEHAFVVWHSALTSRGTSGSPIVDTRGVVVAVNNGGLSAREVYVRDAKTGEMRLESISEATGLNFGVRVDLLRALLR